ncbi:MAG TPA: biliverdin-producing heme oxygenase [Steroidobacteraceae bacterium]|nr:biliverdin-producing heme oxygenase [Steroidobacteraceae bacterium]
MPSLRAATWASHQQLEKRIDFKARLETIGTYREHIQRLWGFYVPMEERLCCGVLDPWIRDFTVRAKAPMLARDILSLGADPSVFAALPCCRQLPPCPDPETAFGCAYVLEGATLGGQSLLPVVHKRLGLTLHRGAAFLASYGDAVADMWREFGAALERCCSTREKRDRAARAAAATFQALELWLCGEPS